MLAKRMTIALVFLLVLFGGIFGYKAMISHFINEYLDNMPIPPATITKNSVEAQSWPQSFSVAGSFKPVQGTVVTAQTSGLLEKIWVENGQRVEQGTPLFQIDQKVEQAERLRLATQLDDAQRELRRLQKLIQTRSASEADVERAENLVEQMKAALLAQDAILGYKIPTAPFDGILGIRKVNLGQFITPGTELITVTSDESVYLQFHIAEKYLPFIEQGMTVSAITDVYPNQTFQGAIESVEPVVQESTRTVTAQAIFQNKDFLLRPGMFARLTLSLGEDKPVLAIPKTAIQYNPYGNVVFVIQKNQDELTVSQRLVRTGQEKGDMVEVLDGLELGEEIASSGLLKLKNGTVVLISDVADVQPSTDLNPKPANR